MLGRVSQCDAWTCITVWCLDVYRSVILGHVSQCDTWTCITVWCLDMYHSVMLGRVSQCDAWTCISVWCLDVYRSVMLGRVSQCDAWTCITVWCLDVYHSVPAGYLLWPSGVDKHLYSSTTGSIILPTHIYWLTMFAYTHLHSLSMCDDISLSLGRVWFYGNCCLSAAVLEVCLHTHTHTHTQTHTIHTHTHTHYTHRYTIVTAAIFEVCLHTHAHCTRGYIPQWHVVSQKSTYLRQSTHPQVFDSISCVGSTITQMSSHPVLWDGIKQE